MSPDVILCCMPTPELADSATTYGQLNKTPVILDLRDMWPDIFIDVSPSILKPFVSLAMTPYRLYLKRACKKATALSGITKEFIHWGQRLSNREPSEWDQHFWLAHTSKKPSDEELLKAKTYWKNLDITESSDDIVVSMIGTMSSKFDLETVIKGARQFQERNEKVRFVFAGAGDQLSHFKRMAEGCSNILFTGWVGFPEGYVLARLSHISLAPYRNRRDFLASIPTKVIESFSAGLPVISSLQGKLASLLKDKGVGVTFRSGDPEDFYNQLTQLANNKEVLSSMGCRASSLFENEFRADKVYGAMADYIEKIAESFKRDGRLH